MVLGIDLYGSDDEDDYNEFVCTVPLFVSMSALAIIVGYWHEETLTKQVIAKRQFEKEKRMNELILNRNLPKFVLKRMLELDPSSRLQGNLDSAMTEESGIVTRALVVILSGFVGTRYKHV